LAAVSKGHGSGAVSTGVVTQVKVRLPVASLHHELFTGGGNGKGEEDEGRRRGKVRSK
jgi:hypothetical protein